MAIERLPEHLKSRRTAEAITAPSAILAAGTVASVVIVAGVGTLAAAVLGAGAYAVVVALRLPRRPRPLQGVDPKALSDPWRRYMQEALDARRRYADVLHPLRAGPIRDRLAEIGGRLDAAVQECWRVASHGDALDEGVTSLGLAQVRARLAQLRDVQQRPGADGDSLQRTIDALNAQIASGERLEKVAGDARNRLEVLDARLDEAVARAVELSLSAGDASELSGLGDDVDQLVGDMEALRQGLEEAGRAQGA